tara:strand:- start:23672 stop:24100 length:429 start_codon:yes stop_codon:yes gene_type:complete
MSFQYVSTAEAFISAITKIEREEDFLPLCFFVERTSEASHMSDEDISKVLETLDLEIESFRAEIDPNREMLGEASKLRKKIENKDGGIYTACEILQETVKKFTAQGQRLVLLELCKIYGPQQNISHREKLVEELSVSLREAA